MNDREELLLEQWKMASQLHQHADDSAWQRASYFVAANGILFSAVLGVIATGFTSSYRYPLFLRLMVVALPVFGALISWVWAVTQRRAQLYRYYFTARARQAEEALTVNGGRILALYEKNINGLSEQDLQNLKDPYLSRFRVYLETWLGKRRDHDLIFWTAVILMAIWVLLFPFVLWNVFHSIWACVSISLILGLLWLWLVWDACLLPHMKRPANQADV